MNGNAETAGPRERLLRAAESLLYSRGGSVGVSALLNEANVARRSLYEHFGGKDGLVTAVLRRTADEDLAWYESALGDGDSPRDRLLALFDRLDELVSNPGFRGCRYLAIDLAFAEQAIRLMPRPMRTGGGSVPCWSASSRPSVMPGPSTLPSNCTC